MGRKAVVLKAIMSFSVKMKSFYSSTCPLLTMSKRS